MSTMSIEYDFLDEDRDIEFRFDIPFRIEDGEIDWPDPRDITLLNVFDHSYGANPVVYEIAEDWQKREIVKWFCKHHRLNGVGDSPHRDCLEDVCLAAHREQLAIDRDSEIERRVDAARDGRSER
jgi:uncharacterized protein YciU (UPF0263 family)